ncbi:transporter substrate-binding domain-containing protein [Cerasicoccus maritimus]|uniref:transporter substrate-binding domain-containing protein n=1 Tax=Cerasicoccus maritimus TaxID=490089 RepID=UPI0028529460|nr:transporter substrate-binding domain-containing protein [Cerasicoccus maritimus]
MAKYFYCLLFFLLWPVAAPLSAQVADSPALDFLPAGELRVGINPEQPPVIFVQDKRIAGLEADLARAFAMDLGVPLNFVVMDWDELIPALTSGKIDIIMSGMTATEVRSVRINFSTPYLVTGQMPLVRASDLSRYPTTLALKYTQARVGVEKGTTGDFLVRENFLYAERVPYDNISVAAADLAKGQIDMVVADAPTVWWLAADDSMKGLTPVGAVLTNEYIAWGIAKRNPGLKHAADSFVAKLQASGDLDVMVKHWLPYVARATTLPQRRPTPPTPVTEEEEAKPRNPDHFQGGAR